TYITSLGDTYLKALPQKYSQGYDISAINGKTVQKIFEEAKPYYCYETEDGINIDLGSLETLDFLGYSEPFTYTWSDGENVVEETYTANDFVSWEEFKEIHDQYYTPSEPKDFVYYNIDEQKSLAVLTLTECIYNQAYIDCVKAMFTEVKQKNIQNVAVDLRGNGGGSSLVGNEFIKYLPVDSYFDCPYDWRWGFLEFYSSPEISNNRYNNLLFEGNVYVLTDYGSFSAAMDFAMLIQDNRLGSVIGEPPANAVNSYGEITYFYLPNTGLYVQISTKKWYRIDGTNTDEYVMPEYPCESKKSFDKLYEIIG
ncbi:MAG: S41 family peptidase, partial [Clostridia bacterium]|nr:S41 family peptidase [Clostridia bacterium]